MQQYYWGAKILQEARWGNAVEKILNTALDAVDPSAAVKRALQRRDSDLILGEKSYDLSRYRRVLLVGAGKAGAPMLQAAAGILGKDLTEGVVVVKEGYAGETSHPDVDMLEAGHPVPDQRSVHAAQQITQRLDDAGENDLVICLISGGGSALMTLPVEGVSLEQLGELTQKLLKSGANINQINALRKHLDRVKGGKLARLAAPADMITLILSDVVGDPLDVIASGPTVPDTTTFADANQVLERFDLKDKVAESILLTIQRGMRGEIEENPKPGDPLFDRVHNHIVGSNLRAAQAAVDQAAELGFNAMLLTTYLQGEARQAGRMLAAVARHIDATQQPLSRPACIVVGGETTVTITGEGYGGRNQELALGAVRELSGLPDIALVTLATDGGDGPTDAAGAIVTGETLQRGQDQGMDPDDFLARNDSYHFFEPLEALLKPGPTQTNVNDLAFLFAFQREEKTS